MNLIIDKEGSNDLYIKIIRSICNNQFDSMIDLCCNEATMTKQLPFKERIYVDVRDCNIRSEQDYFIKADVLGDHEVFNKHYQISFCLDGIEHLERPKGIELLHRMRNISSRQILFTPLGEYLLEDNDDPTSHHSGWSPIDVPNWNSIVLPNYHKALNIGAFFFWSCDNLEEDFLRVKNELENLNLI